MVILTYVYAGLGFTHVHCSFFKVKKDVFSYCGFDGNSSCNSSRRITVKRKQIFLQSVRDNANKQKKQFLVLLLGTHTHTHTHTRARARTRTRTHIQSCC